MVQVTGLEVRGHTGKKSHARVWERPQGATYRLMTYRAGSYRVAARRFMVLLLGILHQCTEQSFLTYY